MITLLTSVDDALLAQTKVPTHGLRAILVLFVDSFGAPFSAVTRGCSQVVRYADHTTSYEYQPVARSDWFHRTVYAFARSL
jgi:hypothetical protein